MSQGRFTAIAERASCAMGHPAATIAAVGTVVGWLAFGPFVGWSDTWQLIFQSITTAVTFVMVFLIQATQNRSDRAMQVKMDALLSVLKRGGYIDLEHQSDQKLEKAERQVRRVKPAK